LIRVRVVVAEPHVDEDRHEVVLQDRRKRRRKAGRDGDDFVSRVQPSIPKLRRRERRQRDEIRGRPGVDEQRIREPEVVGELRFEALRIAIRGQKEIQTRVDEIAQFFIVEDAPRIVDEVGRGIERTVRELLAMVLANQGGNLRAQRVGR